MQLADAYERIEKPREALEVLEALDANRAGGVGIDERMRMAWLYDSTGRRDKAFAVWKRLWEIGASGASRRLVEDRLVTLAAETGALGDLVVELETRLAEGAASKKDSALLVRIYSDTGDSTSAVEVIQEYFRHAGGDATESIEALREQANVYRAVGRYRAFERVTTRLLELDPENRVDHLQALVLNQLENGTATTDEERAAQQAQLREWLTALQEAGSGAAGAEFEAGILELAGQTDAAIATYRRALALNPDHDDNYLLLADLLQQEDRVAEAIAALQYQIETAGEDDAFIVGVDGILNMQPEDAGVIAWAQRRTLERLTARHDKLYLYNLLAELADGAGDTTGYFAALENSLAYANNRRSHVLRELIVATAEASASSIAALLGQGVREPNLERNLRYSRRLISLGEELPPEVYTDMGRTFLRMGDADSAATVFGRAVDSTGEASLVEETGDLFKNSGYSRHAMLQYERALIADTSSVGIRRKLADVRAQRGLLDEGHELYRRALLDLLETLPLELEKSTQAEEPPTFDSTVSYAYRRHYWRLLTGFLYTLPSTDSLTSIEQAFDAALEEATATLAGDAQGPADPDAPPGELKELAYYPRLNALAHLARQAALRSGRFALAEELDDRLLRHFAHDEDLATELGEVRQAWGLSPQTESAVGSPALTASHAAATRALQRGDYALAVHISLFLDDREQALAAYRAWVRERLQSAASEDPYRRDPPVTELLADAHARLDAESYASLCRYVFDLARGRDAYTRKLLLGHRPSWGVEIADQTSPLIEMERTAGRTLLSAREVMALVRGGDRRMLYSLDYEYVVSRLTPAMQVDLVEHLLGEADSYSAAALGVLGEMLRQPLAVNPAKRIVEVLRTWTHTSGGNEAAVTLARGLRRITAGDHRVDPANGPLVAELDRLVTELAEAGRLSSRAVTPGVLRLGWLRDTGRIEEALPLIVDEALRRYEAAGSGPSFRANPRAREEAKRRGLTSFLRDWEDLLYPRYKAEALALARAKEDELGLTAGVFALQDALHELDPLGTAAERIRWLEELARRQPDGAPENEPVLRALAEAYARAGYADRRLRTLERLAGLVPRDIEPRRRLFALWQQLGHPENAMASADGRMAEIVSREDGAGGSGRLEGPPRVAVEKITALDHDGREEQARAGLRMLWQMLRPDGASHQDLRQMSSGEAGAASLDYTGLFSLEWPGSKAKDEGKTQDERDLTFPMPATVLQAIETGAEGGDPFAREGKLLDELTRYTFFVDELEALIRTLGIDSLDNQYLFYDLLAEGYATHGRLQSELERLTRRVESGRAGRKERVLWMELLRRATPERVKRLLPLAERTAGAQEERSHYEWILLARLHARAGHDVRAADLYTAVTLADVSRGYADQVSGYGGYAGRTAARLYDDAERHLDPAGLDRYTADLLRIVRSTVHLRRSSSGEASKLEAAYARLVLWVLARNPHSRPAQEQLQALIAGPTAADWSPEFKAGAAEWLARTSQHEHALQMLRLALRPIREEESQYTRYWGFPWSFLALPSQNEGAPGRRQPGSDPVERPSLEELTRFARVFPAVGNAWPGTPEWTQKAIDALADWIEQGEVERAVALPVLAVAVLRRHQQGDVAAAHAAAARMATFLAPYEEAPRLGASWVVEVMHEVGAPLDLPLLQGLVRHRRLAASALTPALERLAQTAGAEQAVSLGEQALAYTQDEDLLQLLKSLAAEMDRADLVEQYRDVERRAAQARATLAQGADRS